MNTPDTRIVSTIGVFHGDSYYRADGNGGLTVISPGGWNGDLRESHYPPTEISCNGEPVVKPGRITMGDRDEGTIIFEATPAEQAPLQE